MSWAESSVHHSVLHHSEHLSRMMGHYYYLYVHDRCCLYVHHYPMVMIYDDLTIQHQLLESPSQSAQCAPGIYPILWKIVWLVLSLPFCVVETKYIICRLILLSKWRRWRKWVITYMREHTLWNPVRYCEIFPDISIMMNLCRQWRDKNKSILPLLLHRHRQAVS